MAFLEKQLNADLIIFDTVGGVGFNTSIATTSSGFEQRNSNWDLSRGRWDVGDRVCSRAEVEELQAQFNVCGGRLHGFRFKNFSDFLVKKEMGKLYKISAGVYQLYKDYAWGGLVYTKEIKKPVGGTVKLYINNVASAAFTIDNTTGIITIPGATDAMALAWAGEYDVPCRFDVDSFTARFSAMQDDEALFEVSSIPVIEIRV